LDAAHGPAKGARGMAPASLDRADRRRGHMIPKGVLDELSARHFGTFRRLFGHSRFLLCQIEQDTGGGRPLRSGTTEKGKANGSDRPHSAIAGGTDEALDGGQWNSVASS